MGPRVREDDTGMVEAVRARRNDQRSDAVRITNDWVASVAMADPVNWSLTRPICGSSEKFIVTVACEFSSHVEVGSR